MDSRKELDTYITPTIEQPNSNPEIYDWQKESVTQQWLQSSGWMERLRKKVLKKRYVALGAATLVAVGGAWKYFDDKSGQLDYYSPSITQPLTIDSKHKMVSWNMHNETNERYGQIDALAEKNKLDAIVLQEVNQEDAKRLHSAFPEWYVIYGLADAKQEGLDGGYGNVIMTRQKPKDVQSRVIDGSSLLETAVGAVRGFGKDSFHLASSAEVSTSETRDGVQENRLALAATINMQVGGELKPVRLITAHIAGLETVHSKQFEELLGFVKENTKPDRSTIFCGDLNAGQEEAILKFATLGYITPETLGTSVKSGRTIDYCAYHAAGKLGLGKVKVLTSPRTDHFPVIATWGENSKYKD